MADEMLTCSREELRAAIREAEAGAVRKWIDETSMRVRGQTNYYSTIRFQLIATVPAPGTARLQITQARRDAFAYSLGTDPAIAGFVAPTGINGYANAATLTQTNLSKAKETRNGEKMIVTGVSAFVTPGSDQGLAAWVWQHANVQLMKNDTNGSPLGPLSFFPALSSLNGSGDTPSRRPESAFSNLHRTDRFRASEGMTGYYDLSAAPVVWTPSGKTDSSLFLRVELDEAYDDLTTDRLADPALGIEAWTPDALLNSAPLGPAVVARQVVTGTYVDILFRFDGTTDAALSQNQAA